MKTRMLLRHFGGWGGNVSTRENYSLTHSIPHHDGMGVVFSFTGRSASAIFGGTGWSTLSLIAFSKSWSADSYSTKRSSPR